MVCPCRGALVAISMVWQAHERNEWDITIRHSLGATVPSGLPDPFSLADPSTVTEILEGAGLYYGPGR